MSEIGRKKRKRISLDTETTGLDHWHGARPYFVTICDEDGEVSYWEWDVDPLTRKIVKRTGEYDIVEDLREIQAEINKADSLVLQNAPFDYNALSVLYADYGLEFSWPWDRLHDTLLSAHLLDSKKPKDLTSLSLMYLGIDIQPYDDVLKRACHEARRLARSKYPTWAIAKAGRPDMPSAKSGGKAQTRGGESESPWKFDGWLPKAIAENEGLKEDHPWHTVLRDYANTDSAVTLPIHDRHLALLREKGLEKIYNVRRQIPRLVCVMQAKGLTVNAERLEELETEYTEECTTAANRLRNLSGRGPCAKCKGGSSPPKRSACKECGGTAEVELLAVMPKGTNNYIRHAAFQNLKLPSFTGRRKKGATTSVPTMDATAMEWWLMTLPTGSKQRAFVRNLGNYRKRQTALSYMASYRRFGIPFTVKDIGYESEEVHESCEEDKELLAVDSGKVLKRLRTSKGSRRNSSASGELQAVPGGNSPEHVGSSHVRHPSLCKPGTSISGNSSREHARHGDERAKRKSEGGRTPGSKTERGGCAGDEEAVRLRKGASGGPLPYVRDEPSTSLWDSQQRILEASGVGSWLLIHPSLNSTGTDTLRWSSKSPNEQNISKQEDFNLRYCFGPPPGREWWSMDAKNIELRIPAYESGEQEMIDLFERPDEPPYYGSNHLLNFHTVYDDIWDKVLKEVGPELVGPTCKKRYASSWYQYCKNGGFAVQYGAMNRDDGQGTADLAFHKPGSHERLKSRFQKMEQHNQWCISFAEQHGYIETMPDKTVDPTRGYPLVCTKTEYGGILPTVPLNYRTQGTAMWWMMKAMIRCQEYLDELNRKLMKSGFYHQWRRAEQGAQEVRDKALGFLERHGYHMILQVHDELVFEMPSGNGPERNLPIAKELARLMSLGGEDIGLPTPTSIEYHPVCWSEGTSQS